MLLLLFFFNLYRLSWAAKNIAQTVGGTQPLDSRQEFLLFAICYANEMRNCVRENWDLNKDQDTITFFWLLCVADDVRSRRWLRNMAHFQTCSFDCDASRGWEMSIDHIFSEAVRNIVLTFNSMGWRSKFKIIFVCFQVNCDGSDTFLVI